MDARSKKRTSRRRRVPEVRRVVRRRGHMIVRHAGKDYALVPLEDIDARVAVSRRPRTLRELAAAWMQEDEGEQRETLAFLRDALRQSALSNRPRF